MNFSVQFVLLLQLQKKKSHCVVLELLFKAKLNSNDLA